jgi:hypothetical protein
MEDKEDRFAWTATEDAEPDNGMLVLGYDGFYGDVMVCVKRPGRRISPLDDGDDFDIILWMPLPLPTRLDISYAASKSTAGIGFDQRAA